MDTFPTDEATPSVEPAPDAEPAGQHVAWNRIREAALRDGVALVRLAVALVVGAGAAGVVWAALMAGFETLVTAALVTPVALSFALWAWRPLPGAVAILMVGAAGIIVSGIALVTGGTLPWLLVAFWAGSAIVLGAILAFVTTGRRPGRQDAATVVAVVSLLLLSAIAVATVVRSSWTSGERAQIESLPIYGLAEVDIRPAPDGVWSAAYPLTASGVEGAQTRVVDRLLRNGWSVRRDRDAGSVHARRDGYAVKVEFAPVSGATPDAASADGALRGVVNVAVTLHAE